MKKVLISLFALCFVISIFSSAYAATAVISSGASVDTVVKGKTFKVTLAGTSDSPIDGMYTKLNYDKNVLQLESSSAGENYGNNSSEGEILVVNNSSSESPKSATLYTLTFKVLDTANVESTDISFSESELHLKIGETIEKESTNIEKVTVTIKADDTTAGNQEQPKKETTTPSNSNSSSSTTKSNTTKNKKLPQTGIEDTGLVAIVALGAVSITSFVLYKKYKNI